MIHSAEFDGGETREALERRTRELAHSLSMMRATLESASDGILVTEDGGIVSGWNATLARMWRLPEDVLARRDEAALLDVVCAQFQDPAACRKQIDAIHASGTAESFDVLELADGRVFERLSRMHKVDDRPAGRVWTFRDITERRHTEQALREDKRILELLNRTGIAIASTLDLHALVQAVTDAATELVGAQFGAFFYNNTGEGGGSYMLHALSGAPHALFETFPQPRSTPLFAPTFHGEAAIRSADILQDPRYGRMGPHFGMPQGHLPVRSYLAVPVLSRSGAVIGGLFFGHTRTDVFTERAERILGGIAAQAAVAIDNARLYEAAQRAAEERKVLLESERSARAAAERLSEMKDLFLANLSHELRTPLSAIVGWSHVLQRGAKDEADLRKGLTTIERNARIQTQLINDLLDMSRITSGKVRLDIQPVVPVTVIEAAIETARPAAEAKGIRIESLLDHEAGPLAGDPNRLQQIVWNLLSNAIKFTPKGGRVQVRLARVESHVEIAVADTGAGIPAEFLDHVFERFRQADPSTTRTHGGLGLGLSIVRHLVELHGGVVRVESAGRDLGATFTVQLPLAAPQRKSFAGERPQPRAERAAPAEFGDLDLSGIKVLVVDDEDDVRELVRRVLADCGARVLTAASAKEALHILERDRPDALISDIGMPDMDGYELLRHLRENGRKIPAIALTAFARSEDRTRALRAGFLVHVAKPVEPSELIATVASVCGRSGPLA